MNRPGVATTTSTPARRSPRCSDMLVPPTTMALFTVREVRLKSLTCSPVHWHLPIRRRGRGEPWAGWQARRHCLPAGPMDSPNTARPPHICLALCPVVQGVLPAHDSASCLTAWSSWATPAAAHLAIYLLRQLASSLVDAGTAVQGQEDEFTGRSPWQASACRAKASRIPCGRGSQAVA